MVTNSYELHYIFIAKIATSEGDTWIRYGIFLFLILELFYGFKEKHSIEGFILRESTKTQSFQTGKARESERDLRDLSVFI